MNMEDYRMNDGRNAGYSYKFYDRETGEVVLEGHVTGGNKKDCENHAWGEFMRKRDKNKYDPVKIKPLNDAVRLYMVNDSKISEAQKRAQKRYDEANKEKFRMVHLKLNRETDTDVIDKLEAVDNIQGYIKELIRADI